MPRISAVRAHKILNSRGNWTISTEVELEDGSKGHGEIPEGASKGGYEAVSINPDKAVEIINHGLGLNFCGFESSHQKEIDTRLIELDGTTDKHRLGENTILSLSIAVAKATAHSLKVPLYQYLADTYRTPAIGIPTPLFNILNGGKHAKNNLSLQEFMLIPARNLPYDQALDKGAKVYQALKHALGERGYDIEVGDEGGFAPEGLTTYKALDLIKEAVERCSFKLEHDVFFGIDAASNSFFDSGRYKINEEGLILTAAGLADYYSMLINKYPIIYLEDAFREDDFDAWANFNRKFHDSLLVVGDDLTVTNTKRLEEAAAKKCLTAVIVKPNQIGTLTETYAFVKKAKDLGLHTIVSHRSGEAAIDTFIADFAVAVNADYIKAGAPARERVAKYNKVLEIYGELNNIEGFCKSPFDS